MPYTLCFSCLITNLPITAEVYQKGWARDGAISTHVEKYGYTLTLKHNGAEGSGGPLFWAHYSYLGIDPENLKDRYADYWKENKNQVLIDWKWCTLNPKSFQDIAGPARVLQQVILLMAMLLITPEKALIWE